MPDIETAYLEQTAVLWPATGVDAYGQPTVGEPVEIDVRWLWQRRESVGPNGNPIATDATVVADREIAVGSAMWLGELADWYGTGSATDETSVMEVQTYTETPDLKNRATRYELGLAYYRDRLPGAS